MPTKARLEKAANYMGGAFTTPCAFWSYPRDRRALAAKGMQVVPAGGGMVGGEGNFPVPSKTHR